MDDFTPEQLQALIELGLAPEEMEALQQQMAQAEALRSSELPQGQMAGRVFVAPNPLQYLATGVDRYKGAKQMQGLEGQRKDLIGKTNTSRKSYMDAVIAMLRPQNGTPAPSGMQAAGMQPQGGQTFPVQ